jgi:hypothetical protein
MSWLSQHDNKYLVKMQARKTRHLEKESVINDDGMIPLKDDELEEIESFHIWYVYIGDHQVKLLLPSIPQHIQRCPHFHHHSCCSHRNENHMTIDSNGLGERRGGILELTFVFAVAQEYLKGLKAE